MSRTLQLTALLLCLATPSMAAIITEENLIGQGKAMYLGFIKVYDASLYSPDAPDEASILQKDISKCLKLEYNVSLSPADFIKGADTVLARQHPAEEIATITAELATLNQAYQEVEKGDHYTLCYDGPTLTTVLALNGKPQTSIVSEAFARLYFGIWLGPEKPLDMGLRNNLLAVEQ